MYPHYDKQKYIDSHRGFPFNIHVKYILTPVVLLPIILSILLFPLKDVKLWKAMGITFCISFFILLLSNYLIPQLKVYTLKANLFGIDLNKPGEMKEKPMV